MNRLKHGRPSPALIVAVMALVAALAGTAVASNPQATSSAITKKKVKKIARKEANKLLPIGSGELADIREARTTHTIPAATAESHTVDCGADETVISGGAKWDNFPGVPFAGIIQADHRDGNGWRAGGRNFTAAPQPLTIYAYCLRTG
jgi:hypothetical protein